MQRRPDSEEKRPTCEESPEQYRNLGLRVLIAVTMRVRDCLCLYFVTVLRKLVRHARL